MRSDEHIETPSTKVIWRTIGAVIATIILTLLVSKFFSYIFFNIAKFLFGG
jgi:hypothetical protein